MRFTEEPISETIKSNLIATAADAAEFLAVSSTDSPLQIVEKIQAHLERLPPDSSQDDAWTKHALPLGTQWGFQMAREFGWEWASITQHENKETKRFGVSDINRSLVIYPFDYVFLNVQRKEYPTILLAFNMLLAGRIPKLAAGGYLNVMDGVRHVVPPR